LASCGNCCADLSHCYGSRSRAFSSIRVIRVIRGSTSGFGSLGHGLPSAGCARNPKESTGQCCQGSPVGQRRRSPQRCHVRAAAWSATAACGVRAAESRVLRDADAAFLGPHGSGATRQPKRCRGRPPRRTPLPHALHMATVAGTTAALGD
jgi:hypothetical protein